MKNYKQISKLVIIIMIVVLINPLGIINETQEVHAFSQKISKTTATITKGKSIELSIKGVSKKIKWTTSNKKIVKIKSTSGKNKNKATIQGVKAGKATITAKIGNKKYTCRITVKNRKGIYTVDGKKYTQYEMYAGYGLAVLDCVLKDSSSLRINKIYAGRSSDYKNKRKQVVIDYTEIESNGKKDRRYLEVVIDDYSSKVLSHYVITEEYNYLKCNIAIVLKKPDDFLILDSNRMIKLSEKLSDYEVVIK